MKWHERLLIDAYLVVGGTILLICPHPGPGLLVVALAIWYAGERIAKALKDDDSP